MSKHEIGTVTIENVDLTMLEDQRVQLNTFLAANIRDGENTTAPDVTALIGILGMLDYWSDGRLHKPTKYVHQDLTSNGDWDTATNDDGTPSTFDTQAEAEADMQVFHLEGAGAVERGDMDDHNTADWRVQKLEG